MEAEGGAVGRRRGRSQLAARRASQPPGTWFGFGSLLSRRGQSWDNGEMLHVFQPLSGMAM